MKTLTSEVNRAAFKAAATNKYAVSAAFLKVQSADGWLATFETMEIFDFISIDGETVRKSFPDSLWFTISVLAIGALIWIFKTFIRRLDKREENNEKYFHKLTEAVQELEKLAVRHDIEISNIKSQLHSRGRK